MIQVYLPSNKDYTQNGDMALTPQSSTYYSGNINEFERVEIIIPIDKEGTWTYVQREGVVKGPTPYGKDKLFYIYDLEINSDDDTLTVYGKNIFYKTHDSVAKDLKNDDVCIVATGKVSGEEALNKLLFNTEFTGHSNIQDLDSVRWERKYITEALLSDDDNSFVKRWGGELYCDDFDIYMDRKLGSDKGVIIKYGKNIKSITERITEGIVTRIIPVGYDGIRLDGKTPWVDSPLIYNYPNIHEEIIQFSDVKVKEREDEEGYETIEEARAELIRRSNLLFSENNVDKPSINLKIEMQDISKTEEYKRDGIAQLEEVVKGDTVHCYHSLYNVNTEARVLNLSWDMLQKEIIDIEIGDVTLDFFDKQNSLSKTLEKILDGNTVKAESLSGIINALSTKFKAQYNSAEKQHVRAMLFEDTDKNSEQYGAVCIGSMGLEIASRRTADDKDWDWNTFITGGLVYADWLVGKLKSVLIENADGSFKIDLSTYGGADFYTRSKRAISIVGNKIEFYNWGKDGDYIGSIGSINKNDTNYPAGNPNKPAIGIWNDLDSFLSLSYKTNGVNYSYIDFDKYNVLGTSNYAIMFWEQIGMNGYDINLNNSGAYIGDAVVNGSYQAAKVPSLWADNKIWAATHEITGGDYAETFEWADGNTEAEDRVGYLVSLEGAKIVKANGTEIIGIISGTAGIIGDNANEWDGKYLKDKWGRVCYYKDTEIFDVDGYVIGYTKGDKILNPDYDENKEYLSRSERKEWGIVGLLGKLICRDDGTSIIGGYIKAIDGIATNSTEKTKYKVIERIDSNTIKVVTIF